MKADRIIRYVVFQVHRFFQIDQIRQGSFDEELFAAQGGNNSKSQVSQALLIRVSEYLLLNLNFDSRNIVKLHNYG